MLGDVVKLFLCSSCKGLFILDSQVEKHAEYCNGDAFKSPANLFACEREHYLELITPSSSTSKANKSSQVSERKRRKTSPHMVQSSNKSEARVPRRSFLSKDDLSTLSSGTYYGMVTQHSLNTESNKLHVSNTRSQSLPKISSQHSSVSFNGKETVQCSNQQSVLNAVVSRSTPVSQPFLISVTDETRNRTLSSSFSLDSSVSDTSYSPKLQVLPTTHEKLDSQESDSAMVQTSDTPATNLLAFLGQLQQVEPSVAQSDVQREDSLSIVQDAFVSRDQNDLYMLSGQHADGTSVLKGLTVSAAASPPEGNEHADDDSSTGMLKLEDFQFSPVAAVTHMTNSVPHISDFCKTDHDTDDQSSIQDTLLVSCKSEDSRQSRSESSTVTVTHTTDDNGSPVYNTTLSNNETNMHIQDSSLISVFVDTDSVASFQTEGQSDTSAVHTMDMDGMVEASLVKDENGVQTHRPVVYILEPDGNIRPVVVDGILDKTTQVSTSLTADDTNSFLNQNGQHVSQSVALTVDSSFPMAVSTTSAASKFDSATSAACQLDTAASTACQITLSSSAIIEASSADATGSDADACGRTGKAGAKPKSKAQIRLEEMTALREEVLLQSTEIPPDAESKKTRYKCSVCGHIAKSVKFMHNHLQMHNDGKVFFECDQCDFKSRLRSKLAEHQQRHNRSRFLCDQCPATFMDRVSLNRHVTAKHSDNEDLKCDLCDFKASYASVLKEHMMKHTGDLLSCDVEGCGYRTAYLRALRAHQKRHWSDKKYCCHLCSYRAVEKSTLDRHIKSHTQERPYKCSSCDFRANTRYGVVFHMQHKHQQPKESYACDKCDFRTSYASSIAKHLQTHLGTFSCPLCLHTARTLPSIKKHLQKVHQVDNVQVVQNRTKINTKDYLHVESSDKPLDGPSLESLMTDAMSVDSQDLPPLPMEEVERGHIDPMKLSFHFQDMAPSAVAPSTSGTNLTRSSSIPDLFTFSGMNGSTSQSDLLNCPGISTMTRSNSMSDLVSFASTMCGDGGEPVNMDVSLADASAPSMDVGGLSLGDGTEGSLADSVRLGSPAGLMLALQCSKCLALLMNEDDVDAHKRVCTGTVLMV